VRVVGELVVAAGGDSAFGFGAFLAEPDRFIGQIVLINISELAQRIGSDGNRPARFVDIEVFKDGGAAGGVRRPDERRVERREREAEDESAGQKGRNFGLSMGRVYGMKHMMGWLEFGTAGI